MFKDSRNSDNPGEVIDSSRRWVLELELCTSCASFGSRQLGPAVQSKRVHVLVGKIHFAVSPEMTPVLDALLRTMAKVGGRSKRGAAPRSGNERELQDLADKLTNFVSDV